MRNKSSLFLIISFLFLSCAPDQGLDSMLFQDEIGVDSGMISEDSNDSGLDSSDSGDFDTDDFDTDDFDTDDFDSGDSDSSDSDSSDSDSSDSGLDTDDFDSSDSGLDSDDFDSSDSGLDSDDFDSSDSGDSGELGPLHWIGSPCEVDEDCVFEDGQCLSEETGHPNGMCSVDCERFCPDQEGFPGTFCTDTAQTDGGFCHSRCNYGLFPGIGCRDGYICRVMPRSGEPETTVGTCIIDDGSDPPESECIQWLIEHDVLFEPTTYSPRSPDGHPDLVCSIEDPVRLQSPVNGVFYRVQWADPEDYRAMLMSCELARSLYKLGPILEENNIVELQHMGTQNCRVISGTNRLSQHSFGQAIDVAALVDENGELFSVVDDWEHDTTDPESYAAQILYDFAYQAFEEELFTTILTPNYNSAHDDHFHMDLTPGASFIKQADSCY